MMRIVSLFCLLFVAIVVAPGVAFGQRVVNVDFDPSVNLLLIRTYAWGQCGDHGQLQSLQPRIIQDIEFQLEAKGFRKALEGQQPDVIINYRTDIAERARFIDSDYGYGPGWGLGPGLGWGPSWGWNWGEAGGGPLTVEPVVRTKFELTVEIVDAQCNQSLWRGVVTDNLSNRFEKNDQRMRRAVAKVFRRYPNGD